MVVYLGDGSDQLYDRLKQVADQTFYLTHSLPTSAQPVPVLTPMTSGAWQSKSLVYQFLSHWYVDLKKDPLRKRESNPGQPLSRWAPFHKANDAVSTERTDTTVDQHRE